MFEVFPGLARVELNSQRPNATLDILNVLNIDVDEMAPALAAAVSVYHDGRHLVLELLRYLVSHSIGESADLGRYRT